MILAFDFKVKVKRKCALRRATKIAHSDNSQVSKLNSEIES